MKFGATSAPAQEGTGAELSGSSYRVHSVYSADRDRAERILLEAAQRHPVPLTRSSEVALQEMQCRYFLGPSEMGPRDHFRLTGNWLERVVRFVIEDHGIRKVKDAIRRDILVGLDAAGIGMALATFEVVGLPPLRIQEGWRDGMRTGGVEAPGAEQEASALVTEPGAEAQDEDDDGRGEEDLTG